MSGKILVYHRYMRVLLLLFIPFLAHAFEARVVGVSDGDTLTVVDARQQRFKIRLKGIDAPEKSQPFGQKSKYSLSAMTFKRDVEIVGSEKDRYGRLLSKVMVAEADCHNKNCPKTRDANLAQIEAGMAWWYRRYANDQTPEDRKNYEAAEEQARAGRFGLWADPNPEPPWEYRRR